MNQLDTVLNILAEEVVSGRSHLWSWWHLSLVLDRKPELLEKAPVFLALTLKAHVTEAFLTLARLFDKRRDTVTFDHLANLAERNAGLFKAATPEDVRRLLNSIKQDVDIIRKDAAGFKHGRDELLAHFSIGTLPRRQETDSRLRLILNSLVQAKDSLLSLDALYKRAERLLNRISKAYRGGGIPDFESDDPSGCHENTEICSLFG
jgi:hypothetical protein